MSDALPEQAESAGPETDEPAADPNWKQPATWLAGALGLVGGAIGIIGLADADLDRAVVNHPDGMPMAFGVLLFCVAVGVLAPVAPKAATAGLVTLGVLGFAVGLIALVWLTVDSKSASDRPRITAALKTSPDGLRVKGQVFAAGLEQDEHVLLRIVGVSTDDRLATNYVGHPRRLRGEKSLKFGGRQAVYSSRTGASTDGTAQMEFDVPIGAGLYERLDVEAAVSPDKVPVQATATATADQQVSNAAQGAGATAVAKKLTGLPETKTGTVDTVASGEGTESCDREIEHNIACQSLMVPPTMRRPRLAAQWKLPPGTPAVLDVTARMGDLSADDRVLLSVRRVGRKGLGGRLYAAGWAPDAAGTVEEKVSIPVSSGTHSVCVIMRSLRAGSEASIEADQRRGPCPPSRSRGMAVQLAAPPVAK